MVLDVAVNTWYPSTVEAEAGGPFAWPTQQDPITINKTKQDKMKNA